MKPILFSILCLLTVSFTSLSAQGDAVPNVQLSKTDGSKVMLLDLMPTGKVYVLDFWATWCKPCKEELETIKPMYSEWKEKYGVELIAISTDDARTKQKVAGVVEAKNWAYTIAIDENGDLMRSLNFQSVPQVFVVDKHGKIVFSHTGYTPGDELELEEQIKAAHEAE